MILWCCNFSQFHVSDLRIPLLRLPFLYLTNPYSPFSIHLIDGSPNESRTSLQWVNLITGEITENTYSLILLSPPWNEAGHLDFFTVLTLFIHCLTESFLTIFSPTPSPNLVRSPIQVPCKRKQCSSKEHHKIDFLVNYQMPLMNFRADFYWKSLKGH